MATFVISATTATFRAVVRGTSQEAGTIEKLSVGVDCADAAAWIVLQSLVTTKYHIHEPLTGDPVVDILIGPGSGTLTITNLGAATAMLVALTKNTYVRGTRNVGTAQFLIRTAWA